MQRDRLPYILLPLAALIAVLPLILQGCSCGHDFDFHILNWFEVARQFTHGNLHPHWAYTPAYNAGEPRFVFYPPLSWTIGAILGLIFPWTWTPILYTWLALTASGLALHRLARDFTTSTAALLAASFYVVNPYMLFTAYERTAYAELLAAACIPLLLHAILRKRVTIPGIAIPVALLWLTNAPAAVMSCYTLAFLAIVRLGITVPPTPQAATNPETHQHPTTPGAPSSPRLFRLSWASRNSPTAPANSPLQTNLQIARNTTVGVVLGLGVASFYLLPAAYERRNVQIAMAILPGMHIQDNFLFHHTGDALHDAVLHTASLIALTLLALTATVLGIARTTTKARVPHPSQPHRDGWDPQLSTSILIALATLTMAITLLLNPLSAPIWNHLPELAFLQFPWRLLAILAAVLSLTAALALSPLKFKPAPTAALAIAIAAAFTYPAYAAFHQFCDDEDTVQARQALFHSNQGTDPTDEYTPTTADNDSLAHSNPAFWFSPDPNAKASANATPSPAPTYLTLNSSIPQTLILNLRDYPTWEVTRTGPDSMSLEHPVHLQRDDGLLAIPIPAGTSTITITYIRPTDQTIGDVVSVLCLALLLLSLRGKPGPIRNL